MQSKLSYYLYTLLLLLAAQSAVARTPKWVKQRPISKEYYIGIARVSTSQEDFMQIAKNKALTDIISEISIELTSTSVFHQLEENNQLKDTYESWTRTKIKDELEGYELVDSYNKKGDYWVYYRLNIEKYQRIKREKLEKAKKASQSYLESALEAQNTGEIGNALTLYNKAFEAIENHLNDDLSIFIHEHGRIDLGSFIYTSVIDLFSSLSFHQAQDPFTFTPLSREDPLTIKVKYLDNPAQDVSLLTGSFSGSSKNYKKTKTNSIGQALLPMSNISAGTDQELKVVLDLDAVLGEKNANNLFRSMFSQAIDAPSELVRIKVGTQSAVFRASTNETGNKESTDIINSAKKQLSKYIFSEVSGTAEAAFIIDLVSQWNEDSFDERYNLFKVSMNFSISILHVESQAVIYHNTVNDIRGMKTGSVMKAKNDALEKFENLLTEEFIPEINLIKIE